MQLTRTNYKSPYPQDASIDKECLGDIITIYNLRTANVVDNIWLNKLHISHCGDGCIDMVRPVAGVNSNITISHNTIEDADKVMLAGTPYDYQHKDLPANARPYRISIYGNIFKNTTQRTPRADNAIVHVANNTYTDWNSYVVAAYNSEVFFEKNILNNKYDKPVAKTGAGGKVFAYQNTMTAKTVKIQDSPNYNKVRSQWIRNEGDTR
ncbi:MAG: hypothetical protein B7X02_01655 [Rhodospirillales bacterium 12-54-5]|nr:MAG: hypothetical protein B7X02_01655 [Rhodospirillales bacterium 12-54-5]